MGKRAREALLAMGTSIPPVLKTKCSPLLEKGKLVYDDAGELQLELSVVLKTSDQKALGDAQTRIVEAFGMKVIAKMPSSERS
jgi:hypothetical protein